MRCPHGLSLSKKLIEARKAGATLAELREQMLEWHPNTQALADAFAENVEAGLRGGEEEVEAANPYGCNQYGEGWALPHNGMERVRKADLAKKRKKASV